MPRIWRANAAVEDKEGGGDGDGARALRGGDDEFRCVNFGPGGDGELQ